MTMKDKHNMDKNDKKDRDNNDSKDKHNKGNQDKGNRVRLRECEKVFVLSVSYRGNFAVFKLG